jgi:DNA-binding transcriptional MerR regulator
MLMDETKRRWYQASEFAKLSGVTVRTLHHYDRLGLLKPSGRTSSGYRLYGERDFARLQQIVTLKFIGFSLSQIEAVLSRDSFDLVEALRLQRGVLAEKRRQLDMAVKAIERVEKLFESEDEPHWEEFAKIIEVINMQNNKEWLMSYYSEEARREIEERGKNWTPELQAKAEQDWASLTRDIESAIAAGEDPAGEVSQSLAARWQALMEGFTGGNPEIAAGLQKLWADKENWPSDFKQPFSNDVNDFICKAIELRK